MKDKQYQAWITLNPGHNVAYWIGDCHGKCYTQKVRHFKTGNRQHKFYHKLKAKLMAQGYENLGWCYCYDLFAKSA